MVGGKAEATEADGRARPRAGMGSKETYPTSTPPPDLLNFSVAKGNSWPLETQARIGLESSKTGPPNPASHRHISISKPRMATTGFAKRK